jgi:hypothetical protein
MLVKEKVKDLCQCSFTGWTKKIRRERVGVCVTTPYDSKGFKKVAIDVSS